MAEVARQRAGYEDVLAAPPHVVAEVLDGVLYTQLRPAMPQALASSVMNGAFGLTFMRSSARRGPQADRG